MKYKTVLIIAAYFIACLLGEQELRIVNRCPVFGLKDRISIVEKGSFLPWLFSSSSSYAKLFSDTEFIYDFIVPHLREEEKCALKDSDEFRMMFPSAIWLPEKEMFLTIVRISINGRKSFLYASLYDADWNEVFTEEMIGRTLVPGTLFIDGPEWGMQNLGPEDPRIFKVNENEVYVIFNMLDFDNKRKMWLYSFSSGNVYPLSLNIHKKLAFYMEKNWTPIIIDDKRLYFVYNYKNFQIIECTNLTRPCTQISGKYDKIPSGLRGGSPYVQYRLTNYYISLAYTHIEFSKVNNRCHIYRPALTLVKVSKNPLHFELIYTSEPMDFQGKLFLEPITKYKNLEDVSLCEDGRIMMALSISRWNYEKDVVDITFSLNDTIPVAAKVSGLTELVDEVILWYEKGELPREDKCAERLAYLNYDLVQSEITRDKFEVLDAVYVAEWS